MLRNPKIGRRGPRESVDNMPLLGPEEDTQLDAHSKFSDVLEGEKSLSAMRVNSNKPLCPE